MVFKGYLAQSKLSAVFLVLLSFLLLPGCHPLYTDKETGLRLFKLKVAGEEFHISKGYVWAYDHGEDGYISGANLHVLYPNFEPKTDKNKAVFDQVGRGGGRLITFLIKDYNKSKNIEDIINIQLGRVDSQSAAPNEDGLYSYKLMNGRLFFLAKQDDGNNIFFNCNNDSVPHPSCNTYVLLNDEVYIYASFSKRLLPEWRQLQQGLIKKVRSFQLRAKAYQANQGVNGV